MNERDTRMMIAGVLLGATLTVVGFLAVYVTAGHTCVQVTQAETCVRVWVPGEVD